MSTNTIARIEADLEQFISGADPTLDVENIRDLIAEHLALRAELERQRQLEAEKDAAIARLHIETVDLRAEIERLKRLLREHGIEDVQSLPPVEAND